MFAVRGSLVHNGFLRIATKGLGKAVIFFPPSDTCVCVTLCKLIHFSVFCFPSFVKWGLLHLSALVRHYDAVFVNAFGPLAKHTQFSREFWPPKGCKICWRKLRIANARDRNLKALPSYSASRPKEGSLADETAMISFCTCFADGHVTSVTQPDFALGSCLCFTELSWWGHKLEYG